MNYGELLVPIQTSNQVLVDYLEKLNGIPDFSIDHLPKINKLLFGFTRQEMVCITARTSEGKTSFALDLAYNFSKKHKVLYLSLELTKQQAMFRMLCNAKGIKNTNLFEGHKAVYQSKIDAFLEETKSLKMIFCDGVGRTWREISETMEKLSTDKPDIIFLDWVGCIKTGKNTREEINDYVKRFRELAVEHNLCVCLVQQIGRSNIRDKAEPTMDGIKESGIFEEASDVVLVLYYPHKRDPDKPVNDFRIIVSKNRNGMTAYKDIYFEPSMYRFREDLNDNLEPEDMSNLKDTMELFNGSVNKIVRKDIDG